MNIYLDTSVLVAALTDELRTKDVQAWLGRQRTGALAISQWVVAEFSAALAKKQRIREIDGAYRAYALSEFHRAVMPAVSLLEIRDSDFRTAARYCDQHALGLRAADALHLAIAAEHGATLHTLDERLASAGDPLGVRTILL